MATKRQRRFLGIVGAFAFVLTGVRGAISLWQEGEQFIKDLPRVIAWLANPWAGPVVAVLAVTAFGALLVWERFRHKEHSMVGKFLHTFNAQGQQQYQGQVLREDGNRLFVQMFGAEWGDPTNQRYLTDAEAATARFYDTQAEWLEAYKRLNRR